MMTMDLSGCVLATHEQPITKPVLVSGILCMHDGPGSSGKNEEGTKVARHGVKRTSMKQGAPAHEAAAAAV